MVLGKARLFLAVDARAVSATLVGGGLAGRRRVLAFATAGLEPGALAPSATAPNLGRPEEVQAALRRVTLDLARPAGPATLVLPAGIARLALLQVPRGAAAREYVRYRLGPTLPWPVAEAIVDVLPVGGGAVVGAAVRRATVLEYEHAAKAAGLEVERVHLAGLLALSALPEAGSRHAVHVVLDDTSACFFVAEGRRLRDLRQRRRDRSSGEAERLVAEARRAAQRAGDGDPETRLRLAGSDSVSLAAELGSLAAGPAPAGPRGWPQAAEAAWLPGLLR